MVIIRQKQIEALAQPGLEDFKDRTTVYLFELFPDECEELGFDAVRDIVRYAIEVSRTYGIVRKFHVCLYAELMFVYGLDFDQDEGLPWAQEILADESLSEDQAMEALIHYLPPRDAEDLEASAESEATDD